MLQNWLPLAVLVLSTLGTIVCAQCDFHSPAFALPHLDTKDEEIRNAYTKIKHEVEQALKGSGQKHVSYSIVVTSSEETLFDFYHTATVRDKQRPGTKKVDGSSAYRIASNTKAFTVLALLQLQKARKLNLDDSVSKYLPALEEHQTGSLPWKDITLRTLATQLSGIPRNLGLVDLVDTIAAGVLGLPESEKEHSVICDSIWNFTKVCTKKDLYGFLRKAEPLFAPKQQSTYSNINFILLGLVVEKVSGQKYADYLQRYILDDLHMSSTTLITPPDAVSVLPKGYSSSFDADLGVQNPTGGLYSTSDDMAKWTRYILTHYNGLSPAINWLQPQSFSTGLKSFYGMPWEIFRSDEFLSYTDRPVTFVTKSGGWPGYTSIVAVIPEYGFGFVALVGSSGQFDDFPSTIAGIVGQHMIEAADTIAHRQMSRKHVGTFVAAANRNINSSITFSHSDAKGLYITSWTSNSVDVLQGYRTLFADGDPEISLRLQLVPTLLFKDEKRKEGEVWRILLIQGQDPKEVPKTSPLNNNFCMTNLDVIAFSSKPLEEVVFWAADRHGVFDEVELTAWRIRMERTSAGVKEPVTQMTEKVNRGQAVLQHWFRNVQRD